MMVMGEPRCFKAVKLCLWALKSSCLPLIRRKGVALDVGVCFFATLVCFLLISKDK
jgi:hypothetical protein